MEAKFTMTAVDDLPYFAGRPGAVFFPPALSGEIEMLNTSLLMLNFSPLPDDYAAFLSRSDGLFYDGIELYGCSSHYRESKNYKFPNLLEINRNYAAYNFFKNKLVVGRCSESIIYYDRRGNYYALAAPAKKLKILQPCWPSCAASAKQTLNPTRHRYDIG